MYMYIYIYLIMLYLKIMTKNPTNNKHRFLKKNAG